MEKEIKDKEIVPKKVSETKIPIELIKKQYSEGMTMEEFKETYPELTMEEILSAVLHP